jgi:hypothetical protein
MMVHVAARGNNNSDSKLHCSGFQNHRGGGRSNGGSGHGNPNNSYKDHQCQVCVKLGHTALLCWKHFDKGYNGSEKMAHAATSSYTLDLAWYANSAATDHITGDLANGSGMTINLVGQSIVSTLSRTIFLKNVLHVLQSTRNLASIHRFTSDNDVFLNFT